MQPFKECLHVVIDQGCSLASMLQWQMIFLFKGHGREGVGRLKSNIPGSGLNVSGKERGQRHLLQLHILLPFFITTFVIDMK